MRSPARRSISSFIFKSGLVEFAVERIGRVHGAAAAIVADRRERCTKDVMLSFLLTPDIAFVNEKVGKLWDQPLGPDVWFQ